MSVRVVDNALAFAAFGATFDKLPGRGPPVVRICGQIYHNIYSLHPNETETPKHGQLYIKDNEIANKTREEHLSDFSPKLLRELDTIIRENNSYAKAYKMMYEVEQEEKAESLKKGIQPREV